jgi:hypothetical protein
MAQLLKNLSLLLASANAAEGHDWDYKKNGADWAEKYPSCGMKN